MSEAIITGLVAIVVCVISNIFQAKEADKKHNATIELIQYKLDQLTHKVDLHNNAVERLYKVESALGLQEERMRVANHRIEDLEHAEKAGE